MVGDKKIKSTLIITRANYPLGSWSNRVRLIAKGFNSNNVNFKVFVTYPWPTQQNIESSEDFVEFLTLPSKKKENILSIIQQVYSLFKLYKKLSNLSNKPDFILLTGDRFLDTYVVSKYCKKKSVSLYLDIVDEVGRAYDSGNKTLYARLAIWNRNYFNKLLKKVDKVFVISSVLEKKYIRLIGDNKKVIRSSPTFIDENEFNRLADSFDIKEVLPISIKQSVPVITYAGSCVRTNGLFFFLDAVHDITKDKDIDFRIIFVFHIGDVKKVQEYANKLGIKKYIQIFEGVHPKYIPSLYKLSDILVLPEHGYDVANAGFPGKTGEYLISGRAIIATNFSDLSSYLRNEENCMISEIGDLTTYKLNLLQLLVNKELRNKLGENARKTGEKYFNFINATKIYLSK